MSREHRARRAQSASGTPAVRPGVHLDWIDALRGFAMVLLLLLHAIGAPEFKVGVPAPEWLDPLNVFFAPFRMPTLMFVSGMVLAHSLSKPPGVYLLRKAQNLIWPYAIWTAILLNTAGWDYFAQHYLFHPSTWVAPGYLWYLWYLICYSLIALALKRVPAWLIVLGCFVATIVFQPGDQLETYAYYATFFFAGNAFNRASGTLFPVLRKNIVFVPLAAIGIGFGLAVVTVNAGLAYETLLMPANLAGILAAIVFLERHASWRALAPLRWIGRNSIVYYTTHWPIMLGSSVLLFALGLDSWLTIGALVAVFLIATPLAAVRHRRPWKWLFEAPFLGGLTKRLLQRDAVAGTPAGSDAAPGTISESPPRGPLS
ncbi:acyltransferase [Plantibacter flavus]|uniref:acyltransferase family protein n=1 Tax=Plantibacter flavus TaxID=150123 RepID=UPI003F15B780